MTRHAMWKIPRGMTLIELLVVLAIVSIVALVAVFSYQSYIRKSHRMDGINSLLSISLAEERYRSTNTQYGTLAQVWGGVTASSNGYYTLAISGVGSNGYTITATATGNQANDAQDGVSCTPLTFVMNNGTITKTPAACWPS